MDFHATLSLSFITVHLSSTVERRGVNISNRALFICNAHGVGEVELSVSVIDSTSSELDVELNSTKIKNKTISIFLIILNK